jgi:hypothetical protein
VRRPVAVALAAVLAVTALTATKCQPDEGSGTVQVGGTTVKVHSDDDMAKKIREAMRREADRVNPDTDKGLQKIRRRIGGGS